MSFNSPTKGLNRSAEVAARFLKWRRVKNRKYYYLRNYDLTLEEVVALKKKQNGRCAICLKEFKNSKGTHIDHNHYTKKVRGVLCSNCNLGLGNLKDDISSLERAITYLKDNDG